MSCFKITYDNEFRCKKMEVVENREEYLLLRDTPTQRSLINQVRNGNKAAKTRLLQMNYSCLPNDDGTLKGATRVSTSVAMDIDHIAPTQIYAVKDIIMKKKDELGLLMLERSARGEGFHLAFRRRQEMSQEDNLHWASQLLGVAFDTGAKDITRVFFTTTASADDLLYLDDELFRTEEAVQRASDGQTGYGSPAPLQAAVTVATDGEKMPQDYNGIPYSIIVEALQDQMGGVPSHGSRNQFIFTMACHLRYVCNHDPDWVAQVMPDYGEERQRWRRTIDSACDRKQNKMMPRVMLRALDMARQQVELDSESEDEAEGHDGSGNGATPPPMPEKLPPLIQLLVSKTPDIYKAAVAHAVFPPLATHLLRTYFRYIDNVEHEATLMNVLMAGTGAGKNCITAPINCIMKDIRERDAISIEMERQWKEEMMTKGANKDKKKRPEGIVIQEVDADMTNAAFVLRLSEADEHFLYVKMNELDQFDALRTSGHNKSQFQIMCLAFDPGNSYGQTRVGSQSVCARVCVRFNWNASTTIQKGQHYFRQVLTDGPISRINFCTIPEQPLGADMPVYGTYDEAFQQELAPYIERLNAARGLIECEQATKLALKLREENAEFARLSQSRTYENLSYRANVIAFLKAMVLYVAQDRQWDEVTEAFIRWSEQYDLWCKMHFFGEAIDEANGEIRQKRPGPKNLLDELPERFTLEEAMAVRRRQKLGADQTTSMLNNWKSRGYITDSPDGKQNTWLKIKR